MRFPWIKCHNDALMLEIDFYVFYPGNFLQHRAELAHAFITVFALSCNLDRFQDRVVGGLWEKRVGWIGIFWSRRVSTEELNSMCTCRNRASRCFRSGTTCICAERAWLAGFETATFL